MTATVYTQNLNGNGEILCQRLSKYVKVEDVLSCRDELFLQQSVLEDRVEEYAVALQSGESAKKIAIGSIVNDGAKAVIDTKEKMAKIEQWRSQHITKEVLFMLVRNIADMLYDQFAIDDESTEKVASVVSAIEQGVLGTGSKEVTEEELFAEMVSTVPALE